MSTKTIIITACGILLIGGAVYFATQKKATDVPPAPTVTTEQPAVQAVETKEATNIVAQEPTKDTSSDQIIDYLVDDLTRNETSAVEATIDAGVPAQSDVTISTNF